MRLEITIDRVLIGYVFVAIVTESKICGTYEVVLLIIKIAVRNSFGASNFIA
jgi:hypothetical protein